MLYCVTTSIRSSPGSPLHCDQWCGGFGKGGGDEDRLGLPPPQCLRVHRDAPAPGLPQDTGAVDLRMLKSLNLMVAQLQNQLHQAVFNPFPATQ